jgi:hypothetical protein
MPSPLIDGLCHVFYRCRSNARTFYVKLAFVIGYLTASDERIIGRDVEGNDSVLIEILPRKY